MTSMPSDLFADGNIITVDILDRSRDRVGPGPIVSCMSLDCDRILSQAGRFTARFPANDPRLAYLQLKKHFLDFYVDNELVHFGVAENWNIEIDDEGQQILVVSGRDALGELDEISIDFTPIEDSADPVFDAPSRVMVAFQLAGGGGGESWGMSGDTETAVYGSFAGESALKALTKIAEHIGEAFRVTARGAIEWLGTATEDSGIQAVQGIGDPIEAEGNPNICLIQRLTERRDATRMFTAIHPYGAGLGETRLDLAGTTRTAPVGFTLSEADNYISSNAAVTYLGQSITRHVNFKDIRPLYNTDADIESAKNYLFDAALAYLKRNDSVDDIVEYDLDVVMLPPRLLVGNTLRVIYQDDRYDLNVDLVVLGIRQNVSSTGVVSYGLTVAATNQWRLRESSALVAQLEEGEIFAGHPQINACSYWENFREEIGDDQTNHLAEMPFVLAEEVVTIRQVLFRYKVESIVGLVKSYTIAANTGSTAVTIDNTTVTNNGTVATMQNTTVTNNNTVATMQNASPAANNTVATMQNATPAVNTTNATVTIPTSSGLITNGVPGTFQTYTTTPDALTDTNYLGVATATQDPGGTWGTPATHYHQIGTHVHDFAHVHDVNDHNHVMDHSHTATTTAHGHTTVAHAHTMNTHGHTTVAHAHVMNTHTHTSVAHAHTMDTHTHTSVAHSHTNTAHAHTAPALTATYAVERVPALNSYVMADLEYSVNGGSWAALSTGTPVAGGYYQLDLTSLVQNPDGKRRPYQEDNLIQVRRTTGAGTGKTAMIRAKLGIRSTIQSIAQYS